jgi:peptidoglycan/LPS O-acetylase OafA/YrhL
MVPLAYAVSFAKSEVWIFQPVNLISWFQSWMFLCVIAYTLFTIIPQAHLYTVWESRLLPMIVAGTVIHPTNWISRLLESSFLRWIGRLSHSLYLCSNFLL